MRSQSAMVLEPRILFDGAMVATAMEADVVTDAPEIEAVEAISAIEEVNDVIEELAEAAQDVVEPEVAAHTAADDDEAAEAPVTDAAADETDVVSEPAATSRNEVVFLDGRVNDPAAFASEGREVVVLSAEQDGMTQIANTLSGRTGLSAIHIVSHGGDGYLSLGSGNVTAETIQSTNQAALQLIGQALAEDGDILIYACDYAAGEAGLEAMELIADITGADVAASTDATGHESLGGDWALEQSTGEIEAPSLDVSSWEGELATYTGVELVSQLTLSGSATAVSSDTIRLTPNAGTQSGAVQSAFEIDLATDFNLSFSVYLGTSDAGADGVTFVMHNDPAGAQALGASGGGLGASGINDGVVIEFDTYNNGSPDLANDHTSIWDSDSSEVLLAARDLGNIENGTWYAVEVTWTAATDTLSYTFNGVSMGSASGLVAAGRFGSGGTVHFGWTAATGGAMNEQQVRISSFTGDLNFAPTAVNDSFTASEEGATVLGNAASNDTDPENGFLSTVVDSVVGSNGGTLSTDDSGNLVFVAGSSFDDLGVGETRNTVFNYTVYDDGGASDSATIAVTVQGANDAPAVQNVGFDVSEDGGHSLGSLLSYASDLDSDERFVELETAAGSNGGAVSLDDSGNLIFVPGSEFDHLAVGETRETSFAYTVRDGEGAASSALVTMTVHGVNDAPAAREDLFSALEDSAVALGSVSINDSDVDGGELSVDTGVVAAGSQGGVFSFDDSGNLIFHPDGAFEDLAVGETRDTSFIYSLSDGQGGSATATVTVTVHGLNDAPQAQDDSFIGYEDSAITLGSLLGNDSDVDGDDLYQDLNGVVAGSHGGHFSVDDSGALSFFPNADFEELAAGETRDTQFTYTVFDGHGGAVEAVVTVTVVGANDNPEVQDDHYDATADQAVSLGSLLSNDSDVEGDTLLIEQTAPVAGSDGGYFSVDDGGSLIFDPVGDFSDLLEGQSRDTSYTYSVLDGQGGIASANVTVTVHGVASMTAQTQAAESPAEDTEEPVVLDQPVHENEIVFVDARVPDAQAFAVGGRELIVLSLEQGGIEQIALALDGRTGIEAIHIVSHGGPGYLTLGSGDVNASTIQSSEFLALQSMANALTQNGDILIYACEFASGEVGLDAMRLLSQHTAADVAASLYVTGHDSLGGNWALEASVGSVEATSVAPDGWVHLLDVPSMPAVSQPAGDGSAPTAQLEQSAGLASGPSAEVVALASTGSPAFTSPSTVGEALAPAELAMQVTSRPAGVTGFTLRTTRVHDLENSLRDSVQGATRIGDADLAAPHGASVEAHPGVRTEGAWGVPSWAITHADLSEAKDNWLDELALRHSDEAHADDAEPAPRTAPGFSAQLARWAQSTTHRPLTRSAVRG